ncbi:VCBS repeat-containing protein [bacterium]|nr:VCBS repeat-containing protein [bacterium]
MRSRCSIRSKQGGNHVIHFLLYLLLAVFLIPPNHLKAAQTHIAWSRIEQPDTLQFDSIIGAVNLDTIYLLDQQKRIIAKEGIAFRVLPPLTRETFSHIVTHFDADRHLFATVLDSGYASESFLWDGKRWESLGLMHDVPVRLFTFGPNGSIYAAGDWGTIFRRKPGGTWQQLDSPSSQHILGLLVLGDEDYWIGARGEGLYHIHEQEVDQYTSPATDYVDVNQLTNLQDGTLTFRAGSGLQLAVAEEKIVPIHEVTGLAESYFVRTLDGSRDLFQSRQNLLIKSEHSIESIAFQDERIRQVQFLSDGQALALDQEGVLLRGDRQRGLFFHDATNRFRLAGYPAETVQAAMFHDLTGNGQEELTVLVKGSAPGLHVYAREQQAGFLEITSQTGLPTSPGATHVVPGDFNRDGWTDLVLSLISKDGLELIQYKNLGRGRFGNPTCTDQKLQQFDRPSDLLPLDLEGDGDLDLLSVEYYGPRKQRRGGVSFYQNRIGGRLHRLEEASQTMLGFNLQALCMDFNSDAVLDMLLCTRWISDKFYFGGPDGFLLADSTVLPTGNQKTNREGGLALDMDSDGDLDLFLINHQNGFEIWKNDGNGQFADVTTEWLKTEKEYPFAPTILAAAAVDLDLDGDTDILLAARKDQTQQVILLENRSGQLVLSETSIGLEDVIPDIILPVDVDQDGDLDLYIAGEKGNHLFLNRTDRSDWLVVRPHGRGSNPDGLHAVVDVFPTGEVSNATRSSHRRGWSGGNLFTRPPYSGQVPNEIRFGALQGARVDVRVEFYGGRVVWKRDQLVGQFLDVYESYSLASLSYPWFGRLRNQLSRADVQRFLLIFIFASFWMIAIVQLGRKRLQWGILWVSSLVSLNQAAFWTVAILAIRSNHPFSFIAPVGFVVLGTIIPFLTSWSWRRLKQADIHRQSEVLLKHLLVFNHGEWAQNNLNSLQRLVPHYLQAEEESPQLEAQCRDRIQTWQDMTAPNLTQLIEAGRHLSTKAVVVRGLQEDVQSLQRLVDDVSARLAGGERQLDTDNFVDTIQAIRGGLKQLKTHVYRDHSCDAIVVVRHLLSQMEDTGDLHGVEVHVETGQESMWVLLPSFVLADVLDNLLRNALKALKAADNKQIRITAQSMGAKCHLFVTDNGCGISSDATDAIFLEGISRGGSGHGLAQARDLLKRFGGGIHLHWSEPGKGSTFRLDLNEGVKRSESDAADNRR